LAPDRLRAAEIEIVVEDRHVDLVIEGVAVPAWLILGVETEYRAVDDLAGLVGHRVVDEQATPGL
jgi:hypothetical protein